MLVNLLALSLALSLGMASADAIAQTASDDRLRNTVRNESLEQVAPLLETLKGLVGIESGSRDLEGLAEIQKMIAGRRAHSVCKSKSSPHAHPSFIPH